MRVLGRVLDRFAGDRSGNVAVIFSLLLVSLAVLAGGAVDLNQAMNARTRLSQALDAAALAVGVNTSLSNEDAMEIANNFIAANYPGRELGTVVDVVVQQDDENDTGGQNFKFVDLRNVLAEIEAARTEGLEAQ